MTKKIIIKEVEEYLQYAYANPTELNEDRWHLIRNIVEPTLLRTDIFFDENTYEKCIKYCENNFYPLFPYQKFIYAFVFMYNLDDTPLFSTFVIFMGRGNGKDGCIIPLLNFLQTPLYGVKNYHIDIIANNEDQAHESFDVAWEMLESRKRKFCKKFYWTKEKIRNIATRSIMRFNTSNAKTKDGKKSGALLFNEYHGYEDYEQIKVFNSQQGKIKHPRKFIITTNGEIRGGPLDDLLDLCREIVRTGENLLGYFPFLCSLDSKEEIEDPKAWIKANPSMPFLPVLRKQIMDDYLEAKRIPSLYVVFVTKRMNLSERNKELAVTSWENILRACYSDIESKTERQATDTTYKPCVIGIDYADIRDFASAGLLFKVDGEYIWRQHTWICRNNPHFESIKFPFSNYGQQGFTDFEVIETPTIPIHIVVEWVVEQMQKYNVVKIVMDTYRFNLFKEIFENYGIQTETKKNPHGLVRMIRRLGSINTMVVPKIEMAFEDGLVNYGDSAIMRWYTNNTAIKMNKDGNKSIEKIEPKLRKNDGFSAFSISIQAEELLNEVILVI